MRPFLGLVDGVEAQLAAVATRQNLSADGLAAAALRDPLAQAEPEFRDSVACAGAKNRGLHRLLV